MAESITIKSPHEIEIMRQAARITAGARSIGRQAVKDGMTTLGEYWETNPRSHCHDMMGHIIEWYYSGIAGIHPLEPGFRRVSIKPHMPESMNRFSCSYETPYGRAACHWKRDDRGIQMWVTVPENSTAQVMLPTERKEAVRLDGTAVPDGKFVRMEGKKAVLGLGSGTYSIQLDR